MATMRVWLTMTIILWFATTSRATEGLNRWAIVVSPDVQKSGLGDAVFGEASKLDRIEFVERDELHRVLKELELPSLASADGVSQRIGVGQLLRADALVLLISEAKATSKRLRVIVCETRQGTRLATFELDVSSTSVERSTKTVVSEIARVREQFSRGIQMVVGVMPFVSRNLEHRHDHWQSRIAELLANSLTAQRGVAVIEVEEARTILKERALHADTAVNRKVPMIVSGQFRMISRNDGNEADVELMIELTSAKSVEKLPLKTTELSRLPQWLVGDLSRELFKKAGEAFVPLEADAQRQFLVRQADSFSQLGDWVKSLGLREAALVLEPDDARQRARLIQDYQVCFTRDFDRLWSYKKVADGERASLLDQAADQFVSAQEHLEILIRNRKISRDEALTLFRRQKWEGPGALVNRLPGNHSPEERVRFGRVLDSERRFVTDTFLAILELPESSPMPGVILPRQHEFAEPWWTSLLWRVGNQVQCRRFSADSLKFFAQVMTRIVPSDMPHSQALYALGHAGWTLNDNDQKREWKKCLAELSKAEPVTARFFGQAQLWELNRQQVGNMANADKSKLHALVRDADTILREFEGRRPVGDDGVDILRGSRDFIQQYLDKTPNVDSPSGPTIQVSLGRLRFQPLYWTVTTNEQAPKTEVPLFENMRRCGDSLDVYWTQKSLYFMNRPGELRLLPIQGHPDWSRRGAFSHVTWDGECVWLVVAGRGIFVLNRNGGVVAQFTKETPMPGIEAGLQMLPLAPRRMLAVGSFGEHQRAWCGVLEVSSGNQPSVRIFHEATHVAANRPTTEVENDVETAFRPTWIQRFERRDASPLAFVGRDRCAKSLTIDLDSFSVGLVPFYPRGFPGNDSHFRRNGHFVNLTTTGVFGHQQLESGAVADENRLITLTYPWSQMLDLGDLAYITGATWWSINTNSLEVKRLLPGNTELPNPYRGLRHGISAHYGLIGYRLYVPPKEIRSPTMFQITVADESTSSQRQ